jgi:hypothetical protein
MGCVWLCPVREHVDDTDLDWDSPQEAHRGDSPFLWRPHWWHGGHSPSSAHQSFSVHHSPTNTTRPSASTPT